MVRQINVEALLGTRNIAGHRTLVWLFFDEAKLLVSGFVRREAESWGRGLDPSDGASWSRARDVKYELSLGALLGQEYVFSHMDDALRATFVESWARCWSGRPNNANEELSIVNEYLECRD